MAEERAARVKDAAAAGKETALCSMCRSEVAKNASRCRHCGANLIEAQLLSPHHKGTCPFCKKNIKPDAIVCRFCGSSVVGPECGPSHEGTCPFCKEEIDPQATICPMCRNNLAPQDSSGMARLMRNGWESSQECETFVYDACIARGDRSAGDCAIIAQRVCANAGNLVGGYGNAPIGGNLGAGVAFRSSAQQSADCSCEGCAGGRTQGEDPMMRAARGGGGGIKYVTRCHYVTGWVCTAQGCRPTQIQVCITYPTTALTHPQGAEAPESGNRFA
jgi:RNA polymerase subunit RPABC4/transcription elongation factor Spt4